MTHPQQTLGAALQNISETAAVNLPQINNLKWTIDSQRKDNDLAPVPLRREDSCVARKVPGNKDWGTICEFW